MTCSWRATGISELDSLRLPPPSHTCAGEAGAEKEHRSGFRHGRGFDPSGRNDQRANGIVEKEFIFIGGVWLEIEMP